MFYGECETARDRNAFMDVTGSPTAACRLYCASDTCVLQTRRLTERHLIEKERDVKFETSHLRHRVDHFTNA